MSPEKKMETFEAALRAAFFCKFYAEIEVVRCDPENDLWATKRSDGLNLTRGETIWSEAFYAGYRHGIYQSEKSMEKNL